MEKIAASLRSLGIVLLATGLSWSHSLISIGVALTAIGALADRTQWPFLRSPSLLWLSLPLGLLYLLQGLSWFYTAEKAQWWVEMRIKLPFLFLLPCAAAAWSNASPRVQQVTLSAYHLSLLIIGIGTVGRLLQNPTWAFQEIREGRYVPMVGGISHIYYAGLVGVALFFLGTFAFPASRVLRGILAGLYLLILHTLALRTGIVALYLTLAGMSVLWAGRNLRRWAFVVGGGTVLLILVGALVAYFPPLRQRWEHLKEDWATYAPGKDITYTSVARRLAALEASYRAFRRCPWLGTGMADNQRAVTAEIPYLPYHWDPKWYILPHNQFVEYAVGLGLVGVGCFLLFWVVAFAQRGGLLWVGWLVYWLLLLQGEAFLERQIGVTAFLWGTGLLWSELTAKRS